MWAYQWRACLWQVLELEEAIANLSVIHVAGTKGKVRLFMRFDIMHPLEGSDPSFDEKLQLEVLYLTLQCH